MILKKRLNAVLCLIALNVLLAVGLTMPLPARAQVESAKPGSDYGLLQASIAGTIGQVNETVEDLTTRLRQVKASRQVSNTEIEAYQLQLSTHGNLLLVRNVEIKTLEKARGENRLAADTVRLRLKNLTQKAEGVTRQKSQTEDQLRLTREQLDILATRQAPVKGAALRKELETLTDLLEGKARLLDEILGLYHETAGRFEATLTALDGLAAKFDEQIEERRRRFLFSRTASPITRLEGARLVDELAYLGRQVRALGSAETWQSELHTDWTTGKIHLLTFVLLFAAFQFLLTRLHRYLENVAGRTPDTAAGIRHVALRLVLRSIYLAGATFFVWAFSNFNLSYGAAPFWQMVVVILLILLFTRWGHGFVRLWLSRSPAMGAALRRRLHHLLIAVRYLAIAYTLLDWLLEADSALLIGTRLLLEAALLIWGFAFWKAFKSPRVDGAAAGAHHPVLTAAAWATHLVFASGIVLDLLGYGRLATYWYVSWGQSGILLLWSLLFFSVLTESRRAFEVEAFQQTDDSAGAAHSLRWFGLQIAWLLWGVATVLLLLVAWGSKQTVLINFFQVLNHPVAIGSIRVSLMNFVYAFLILVMTHAFTRVWRYLLKDRILVDSGLEVGLQDSITMITVYAFWAFGSVLALNAFGFGTTSLAVGFGALGIGLGFGLQNIFNNFISGIILLIERPIQVGDDVEINGVWATVKKINVRSTVVQTYDNASLIIPNSEFISQQVTNWSFKDKRLRRNIDVGVAYGSDIELVRATLLEIAEQTPRVFKEPQADVLFRDFGDSALVFRLRIWTDIDNIFKVETAIRFEIDRLFKERKIVIAFPQQDVHLFYENAPKSAP